MSRAKVTSAREDSLYPQRGEHYFTSTERDDSDAFEIIVRKIPAFVNLGVYFEYTEREREGLSEENYPMWHGFTPVENILRRGAA
jgi:hypothetical protein